MEMNVFRIFLIAGLLVGTAIAGADAQCVGPGGVPFNCAAAGSINDGDFILMGQGTNTVKATALQMQSYILEAAFGPLVQVPLDLTQVTTGGVAVNALNAGHRNHGGWLQNPQAATVPLCINEIGTASGTVSFGDTTCIAAGQSYEISPGTTAVSVISSDSTHHFSGLGLN